MRSTAVAGLKTAFFMGMTISVLAQATQTPKGATKRPAIGTESARKAAGPTSPAKLTLAEVIRLSKAGATDQAIIARIDQSGLFLFALSREQSVLLEQVSEPVRKHLVGTQFNSLDNLRLAQQKFAPISPGNTWQYDVKVQGTVRIPYSQYGIVRPMSFFKSQQTVKYTVGDRVAQDGTMAFPIRIENNFLEPYPWVGKESPSTLDREAVEMLAKMMHYKSSLTWRVIEQPRTGPGQGQLQDVIVSEDIGVSLDLGREEGTASHELLRFPAIGLMEGATAPDGKKSTATTYRLHEPAVRTPAGLFANCLLREDTLHATDGDWKVVSYFAPNVGLVMQYEEDPKGARGYVMELSSYKVANDKSHTASDK